MNIFDTFASIEIRVSGSECRVDDALAAIYRQSLSAESARLSISHRGGEDEAGPLIIRQVRAKARPDTPFGDAKMAALTLSLMLNRSVVSLIHEGDTFTICCDPDVLTLHRSVNRALRIIGEADKEIQVGRVRWTVDKLKAAVL